MTATYKRVCNVIGELAGLNPVDIAPAQALGPHATPNFYWNGETPPRPLALDTLVNLAMQLEDEFKITMTDDEVDDPALDHVGGLVAFVQGKLDARAAALDPKNWRWGPPLVIHATATASSFESIGFDQPRTPTSSGSSAPTQTDGTLELTEEMQVTNCGVIDVWARAPFERFSVSRDDWLRIGGHGKLAYAKRIFETGWFEGISREKDRNGRTLQAAWAAFAEREGLK